MAVKKVVDEVNGVGLVRMIMDMPEPEISDMNTFTQATECVVNLLCKREGEVGTVLDCLDILVQVGHMWLGAAQFGSEIGSVQ